MVVVRGPEAERGLNVQEYSWGNGCETENKPLLCCKQLPSELLSAQGHTSSMFSLRISSPKALFTRYSGIYAKK